jgi:hypothetical protein
VAGALARLLPARWTGLPAVGCLPVPRRVDTPAPAVLLTLTTPRRGPPVTA